jgi:hypothetical protein
VTTLSELYNAAPLATSTLTGVIEVPANKIYDIDVLSTTAQLNSIQIKKVSGAGNVSVLLNGVALAGLDDKAVTASLVEHSATATTDLVEGDVISLSFSGVSGLTDFFFSIKYINRKLQ